MKKEQYEKLPEDVKNKNNTDFENALSQKDLVLAQQIFQRGVNVQTKFDSLIGQYCVKGDVDIVRFLLSKCSLSQHQLGFHLTKCISNNHVELTHYLIDDYLTNRLHQNNKNIFQKFRCLFSPLFKKNNIENVQPTRWTPNYMECRSLDFYEHCIPGKRETLIALIGKFGLDYYEHSVLSNRAAGSNDVKTLQYLNDNYPSFTEETYYKNIYDRAIVNDNVETLRYLDSVIPDPNSFYEEFLVNIVEENSLKCFQYFIIEKNINFDVILNNKSEFPNSSKVIDWAENFKKVHVFKETLENQLINTPTTKPNRMKI